MSQIVENISDTARWVAIFRAEESERPDAVFHDPFARKLAGEKGEQIANAIEFGRKKVGLLLQELIRLMNSLCGMSGRDMT